MSISPRAVFNLDITDFRPMTSGSALQFLQWLTRGSHGSDEETAASRMQAGDGARPALELRGAWYAVGVTGHKQFRAFSLYECHGGWDGGWRQMIDLYRGVPDSLFLSAIDGLRFEATTVPLVSVPGCPRGDELDGIGGAYAMIEFSTTASGKALEYLAAVREERVAILADYGFTVAGLYEVAFRRDEVCTLWVGDTDGHVRYQRARDAALGLDDPSLADERILAWETRSAELLGGRSEELLLAGYPGPSLSGEQAGGA